MESIVNGTYNNSYPEWEDARVNITFAQHFSQLMMIGAILIASVDL